jgi:hypothetical protein
MSSSRLSFYISEALIPLDSLHAGGRPCELGPDFGLICRTFPSVLRERKDLPRIFHELLLVLQRWQSSWRRRSVLVHGDYWLGNLLFAPLDGRVSGIIDWDRCRSSGYPGFDALHLGIMSYSRWRGVPAAALIGDLLLGHTTNDFMPSYVEDICRRFDLSPDEIKHLAAFVWFSYVINEYVVEEHPRHSWFLSNVTSMFDPISGWLSGLRG